ncbi:5-methylcytosine restriction system specificity protein McrC [Corynebacterium phocae]|nr:restriction endonuclease [Corynebacterium phocae]
MYASDAYASGSINDGLVEETDEELPALLAQMLCKNVEDRLRRDLSVGFTRTTGTLYRVRGKIDVDATARKMLLEQGKVRCQFNDLTFDNQINRFILRALMHSEKLLTFLGEKAIAGRCRRLSRVLINAGVRQERNASAPAVRLAPEDRKPVNTARLLLDLLIPSRGAGMTVFKRVEMSEDHLRRLFEKALLGLYALHLEPLGWKVRPPMEMRWPVEVGSTARIPVMRTDIVLQSPHGGSVILDAKFANMATAAGNHHANKLKAPHLYQIFSYVLSFASIHPESPVSGAVLYAALGQAQDFPPVQTFTSHGHHFAFGALDLEASPRDIRTAALDFAIAADRSVGSVSGHPGRLETGSRTYFLSV